MNPALITTSILRSGFFLDRSSLPRAEANRSRKRNNKPPWRLLKRRIGSIDMRLKTLELHGFKSFAPKTILEFNNPIVAIVGPNGSGKSNVVEAFRFVLGEQSMKSMRGKLGADLIFKGSKSLQRASRGGATIYRDNSGRDFKCQSQRTAGDGGRCPGAENLSIQNQGVRAKTGADGGEHERSDIASPGECAALKFFKEASREIREVAGIARPARCALLGLSQKRGFLFGKREGKLVGGEEQI